MTAPTAWPVGLGLSDRTVFVAGGGSAGPGWSIGRAACVTYARLGARVCVADRDRASAEETAAIIRDEGGTSDTFVGDIADEADVVRMFAEAKSRFGVIDVLHHNVGIGKTGGPLDTKLEDFDLAQSVNVRSLLLASRQVLPDMVEQGRGAIIAISSVAGMRYLGYPHLSYCVTKAAVIQFTRMLAQQYAANGIRANTVVPGLIDTPRIANTVAKMFSETSLDEARAARARQVPLGRMGTAWDVANACAFLASDAAAYVTGTELVVDGGLTGKFA
ncbi:MULTISPECIES: SDR family NAD(P)-dependent oxidoreductase [Cupriavidus]|jgi:NAD(P)-dependent dehydrogenase (short-subunit alcohol dehydrogenase family)|uniref:SDR family oxidoreductase n=1 Tax=Cupriavidus pauculus TaxID=82633 RepID=A0A5P2GZB3_9BURK|nr:SDR family NAD(P)-dependent oxidoreductase [Cupriavidus pauculus]QET00589.1 SDR family oxidoreductase [Cupriavidus pauculus]